MRWISILVCSALLAGSAAAAVAQAAPAKTAAPGNQAANPRPKRLSRRSCFRRRRRRCCPKPLTDGSNGAPKSLADPAQADPANAAALKEYDYTGGASATYKREGETLSVRALRFQDASGAYGAYSFYRQNGWAKEDIGAGATSDHNRVLFWKGDTVVDATFSHIGPMSAGGNARAGQPRAQPSRNQGADAAHPGQSAPGLAGPADHALRRRSGRLCGRGRRAAAGSGRLRPRRRDSDRELLAQLGPATLTIIDYPTPQMAEAQEPKIRDYIKAGSKAQPAWPKPLQDSDLASLEVRRSGPLVAIVSGDAIPDESHKLLEMVHYEADLTAIPQPTDSEVKKTAQLLMGIAAIVIVGGSAALLLGFFLGGGRALYRIMRGKPASSVFDEEFIRIDLREEWDETARSRPKARIRRVNGRVTPVENRT